MPYMTVCTIDPDDGLVHDPGVRAVPGGKESTGVTACGRKVGQMKRCGTGGTFYNRNEACQECWPFPKDGT